MVDGLWGTHTDARASGGRAVEQRSPFVVSLSEMSMSLDQEIRKRPEEPTGTVQYSVEFVEFRYFF